MRSLYLLVFLLLSRRLGLAEETERGESRTVPYWNLWSSDFFGWVEELRAQAAYDRIQDLARTFWAHFSGYDGPDPEAEPQPEA